MACIVGNSITQPTQISY